MFYKTYILPSLQDNLNLGDISTSLDKKFPFSVFLEICNSIKNLHNIHEDNCDAQGTECITLPLLVLGSLRTFGSACNFDTIEELSCVDQDMHRKCFHIVFCTWG